MRNGLLVFVFSILCLCAHAQAKGEIVLRVVDISSNLGEIRAALYTSPEGFPDDTDKSAYRISSVVDESGDMILVFRDIPMGEYVVAVFHDENNNGKLDKTTKGIPLEPLGFSNNPAMKFGPPKYENAVFVKDKNDVEMTISLKKYRTNR